MMHFIKKPYSWALVYSLILMLFFTYVLLDTFVIPKALAKVVVQEINDNNFEQIPTNNFTAASLSYEDENIIIAIEKIQIHESTVYVADIELSDISYLKTAFAENTYGLNIYQKTSEIAEKSNAILAINGDFYGFRKSGYVIRNGSFYRKDGRKGDADQALVIDKNGDFIIIYEKDYDETNEMLTDAWQVFCFGPALVESGTISVNASSRVAEANLKNPVTAIGQISSYHYIFIVADGRSENSQGLTLLELAQLFESKGCTTAYNLDGGGSSAMWFNGEIISNPTDGRRAGEREVSDIVYIGK